ncbi:uncharacterized protein TRIADDRAFT_49824 [Trichoplax adhaerens]|uniref:[histone H3]-dimethyl-L-lysine(36) demethylase n=1 Tax=Trichoplax adhaerens TaxID=10228 RepID=B3RJX0_TRIAD|nr:hypothetical protein TRIADDRAFT_49824 [Trichoplax adhaerens]EDV29135.1 hypothetical protein TRIADDRAFT_49824 [Trichoplax adhaerens]|eukprot:XP_002108337.1 hypothetical protein TRIADDRAFT_49824 [Trichoplax adhaerens]
MQGSEFNVKYLQQNGWDYPILLKSSEGTGLKVPPRTFTVNDVQHYIGTKRIIDVLDVNSQKGTEMTMTQWVKYYNSIPRKKILNVISLEFSHSKLDELVESPTIVRDIDWVDNVWPDELKMKQTSTTNNMEDMKYPKVKKYVLMSVAGCYTDFHIDFGGTSVWYHILRGSKIFWLIPPTDENLEIYQQWVLSGKQQETFLGDLVSDCSRICLNEGDTFMIPTAWIHAVYTPTDALVFGGNFLHSYNIAKQLQVHAIEDRTEVNYNFNGR